MKWPWRKKKSASENGGTSIDIAKDSNAPFAIGDHARIEYYVTHNAPSARSTQVGRLHQLPPEEVNFHGRQTEERDLIAALQPGSAASIGALNGMGGIGKSALAARIGRRVAQRFPDAQLWVRLNGSRSTPLAAAEAMKRVIRALEPLVQIPDGEQEVEELYRHLLHERRCLIVLDDARDANQVRPLLPPAPSAALITSRQTITLGGTRIRLDALPLSEAVAVLRQILAGHDIAEAELERLAEGCHRLPLALQAAGTFLAENQAWTVARYLDAMPDQRRRMTELFRHANNETLDVYAVLGLSVERLQEASLDRACLWGQLAVFSATFDTVAAAAVWGARQEEAGAMLDDLVRRTLVEVANRSDGGARYRLHDFLRDLAEAELDSAAAEADPLRQAAERRFGEHYKSVLSATNAFIWKAAFGSLPGWRFTIWRQTISCAAMGRPWHGSRIAIRPGRSLWRIMPMPEAMYSASAFLHVRAFHGLRHSTPLVSGSATGAAKAQPWAILALPIGTWARRATPSSFMSRR